MTNKHLDDTNDTIDTDDTIVVKTQRMFPNCQKYEPCCKESGYEETMKKVKKIHNFKEMIEDIIKTAQEKNDKN